MCAFQRLYTGGSGSTMSRIMRHKAPFVEPRDGSQFQQIIDGYKARLEDPSGNGAVFFAVCRGKVRACLCVWVCVGGGFLECTGVQSCRHKQC